MLKNITSKPYIIRAIYEWCTDCGYDPQLVVFYHPACKIPTKFIDSDNEVIFNINWQAVKELQLNDDSVSFAASFDSGVSWQQIYIPMPCIKGVYALQTADGMIFDINSEELASLSVGEADANAKIEKKSEKPLLKRLK